MPDRLPRVTGRQMEQAFRKLGFRPVGGGPRWKHPDGRLAVLHLHPARPVPIGTLRSILSQARVSVPEFVAVL